MIVLSILSLIISFLIQGISSNYFNFELRTVSLFLTIYPIINLLIITPHFENNKKLLLIVMITGFLVDTVYTNTFILNACIFVAVFYIAKYFHFFFPYNLLTINISCIISIMLYHIISFL